MTYPAGTLIVDECGYLAVVVKYNEKSLWPYTVEWVKSGNITYMAEYEVYCGVRKIAKDYK